MSMEKEDWGKLAIAAGFVPLNTESSARRAFDFCAEIINQLADALEQASSHLDYCGYGDAWERECAEAAGLEKTIADALKANPLKKEN